MDIEEFEKQEREALQEAKLSILKEIPEAASAYIPGLAAAWTMLSTRQLPGDPDVYSKS